MARKENYHADLVDVKLRFLKGNGEDIPDYLELIRQRAKDKGFIVPNGKLKGEGNINAYIIDLIEKDIRTTEENSDFKIRTSLKDKTSD